MTYIIPKGTLVEAFYEMDDIPIQKTLNRNVVTSNNELTHSKRPDYIYYPFSHNSKTMNGYRGFRFHKSKTIPPHLGF